MSRRFVRVLSLGALWIWICLPISGQGLKDLARTHEPKLKKVLTTNIQDFWLRNGLDRERGGYLISFDDDGRRVEPYTKMIVTQARQLWLHSRLARAGYKREENLKAAAHGYKFLREKMWDSQHGGFFWEVEAAGQPLRTLKHLYGQSFGLYALSEYALATRDKGALALAVKLFQLLEEKAHDAKYQGYNEIFAADWQPVAPGTANYISGAAAPVKLYNTHLHLLESVTTFYRASKLPLARTRLLELIEIETDKVVRKEYPLCTDVHRPDWTPVLEGNSAMASYGHDLENIWLVMDACRAVGVAPIKYRQLFEGLFAYSLKYGFDQEAGGFFSSGPFNQPATNRDKVWWAQAEALVACLWMHRLTGEQQYLDVFAKTWDFVEKRMIDWEHGEWRNTIDADGRVRGPKANIWKAGYHNGRSMIECLARLQAALKN
ncbi:MAG TPA: AGE family epimerase/isomerase [Blastocatellia bacterium]|nr:AGE family epimerase/isomerase [Blastocatellia bacterium]